MLITRNNEEIEKKNYKLGEDICHIIVLGEFSTIQDIKNNSVIYVVNKTKTQCCILSSIMHLCSIIIMSVYQKCSLM